MSKTRLPPAQEKLNDVLQASSVINQAVKLCTLWDHNRYVEEAVEKLREAQQLLKKQYEEWSKAAPR